MTIFCPFKRTLAAAMLLIASILGFSGDAQALEVPASAYGAGAIHEGDASVESRLVVDAAEVAPGDTINVGVVFTLKSDWHIYWKHPGDAGVPTNIEWHGEQLDFGPLQWASPKVFTEADGEWIVYGYGNEVLLFSEATVAEDASGTIELGANVDYLACSNLCMPGHSRLSRSIPVGPKTVHVDDDLLRIFTQGGERVPRKVSDLGLQTQFHYSQAAIRPNDEFNVLIELIECRDASADCRNLSIVDDDLEHTVIPDEFAVPDLRVTSIRKHPDVAAGWLINLSAKMPADAADSLNLLAGVLEMKAPDGTIIPVYLRNEFKRAPPATQVDQTALPFEIQNDKAGAQSAAAGGSATPGLQSATKAGTPNPADSLSLAWVLLLAFLGGMILNLMPCVFPVLALKVSSFANIVHESKRGIVTHGAAYTGGIVGSMLLLAGVVIGLRVGGTQVGWGFQFQQPHFLAILIIILVLFALNLFGVFEVTVGAQSLHDKAQKTSGVRRSVWEGVLAVILATPCSAPFLGTAVGFALASGPGTIVAVFMALGLGLAAPMVVLTLVPGWARLLPKPGMWMEHLKTFLGFALLGSAIWIFWLLGRQAGVDAMAAVMMFTAALGLAAWIFGLVQFNQWSGKKAASLLVALAALAITGALAFPLKSAPADSPLAEQTTPSASKSTRDAIAWEAWSDEAVNAALKAGRPVFVDFGADWCLTCKVNEKNAIDTPPVRDAIVEYNVATFYADWTNPDERIRLKLAEYGKAGVPFYLVYSPDTPEEARPMPEVLTSEMLVNAFAEAAP